MLYKGNTKEKEGGGMAGMDECENQWNKYEYVLGGCEWCYNDSGLVRMV